MTEKQAEALRECARQAFNVASLALGYIDSAPTAWRGSPIWERDAQEVRAGLERIRNAAEELLRL